MADDSRGIIAANKLSTLIARFLFLLVALFSLYKSATTSVWWQTLVFFVLVLVSGLLIEGGYEDIKFTLMEWVGMEVSNAEKSRTINEVQDLLSESDSGDLAEVNVNEAEGTCHVRFDRE